ncbi:MAG: hypothetical protein JWP36_2921 [Paucimonas sp.]|nr:hypothetical protein [Paucimonas sp.]
MGIGKLIRKIQRAVNGKGGEQAQNQGARPKPATSHKSQELSAESLGGHVRSTRPSGKGRRLKNEMSGGSVPAPAIGFGAKAKKRKAASPASARRKEAKRTPKAHSGEIANPRQARNVQQMDAKPRITALADVLASQDIGRAPVPMPKSVPQELETHMASLKPAPEPVDTASDSPGPPDWEAPDDLLERFASESFVDAPSRSDEEIRAYSLLRLGGLNESAAEDVVKTQGAGVSASQFQEFFAEAGRNRFLKYDFEAAALYCAARALGDSPARAVLAARNGPLYLESSMGTNGMSRTKIRTILRNYGLPTSPMLFPRRVLDARMDVLGAGSFSTVYKVTVDGSPKAFKPFILPKDQEEDTISQHGLKIGLSKSKHFAGLRHIAVVRAQQAMGLTGDDAVVGHAEIAIINGEPGLLMDLAEGGSFKQPWFDEAVLEDSPHDGAYLVALQLAKFKAALENPETRDAQLKLLGIYDFHTDENGDHVLTGTAPPPEPGRYRDAGFKKAMSNAQYLAFIMNIADLHLGNLYLSRRDDGSYKITMIDLGDSLGRRDIRHLLVRGINITETYRLAQDPRYVDQTLVDTVQRQRCQDLLANLEAEMKGCLDQDEINGISDRISWVESNRSDAEYGPKTTKVLDGARAWTTVKMRGPTKSWVGKWRGVNIDAPVVEPTTTTTTTTYRTARREKWDA